MSNNFTMPIVLGSLAAGNQPLSDFDTDFDSVARMGTLMCTAAGTNTIVLTIITNYPTPVAYGNIQKVGFLAANNSSGNVTIQLSSLSALSAYQNDGVTQITSGDLAAGSYYEFAYNSTLNSSAGGWQLVTSLPLNLSVKGTIASGVNSGAGGQLTLNGSSTGSAIVKVASAAGSSTFQLPVGNGTNGQILVTNGSGVTSWVNPTSSSGALILLSTVNASAAAAVTFDNTVITNTYNKYQIEFDSFITSGGSAINMVVSTNNGSTYISSGYNFAGSYQSIGSATISGVTQASQAFIDPSLTLGIGSNASLPSSGTMKFSNPSASQSVEFFFDLSTAAGGNIVHGFGYNTTTTPINNIKIALNSGNITGNFHLYGIVGQ